MMRSLIIFVASFAVIFSLTSMFTQEEEILEPVDWSVPVATKISDCEYEILFRAEVNKGWHLYGQNIAEGGPIPTSFNFNDTDSFTVVGKADEPKGHTYMDPLFGMEVTYHEGVVDFKQKIKLNSDGQILLKGYIEYMVCNDETCLPPEEVEFNFTLQGSSSCEKKASEVTDEKKKVNDSVVEKSITPIAPIDTTTPVDSSSFQSPPVNTEILGVDRSTLNLEKYKFADRKEYPVKFADGEKDSLTTLFLIAFGFGLLALLTPCVFPMIPMTVSFFLKGSGDAKKSRFRAIFFGVSIILIYCSVGMLMSIFFGPDSANLLATHWIPNLIFFAIFVVFAISFFGAFELTLPASWVSKSDQKADRGGLIGVFFMALTTVIVSFSCTGPLAGTLLVQASLGGQIAPLVGMLGFSLAFALPFTMFAFFPSMMNKLPKSGGWLNSVKIVFGFIELAAALKFLSIADLTEHWGILSRDTFLIIWIVIFLALGAYLLGWIKFPHDSKIKKMSIPRLGLAIISIAFSFYMIGGFFGNSLTLLSGLLPPEDKIVSQNSNVEQEGVFPSYSDVLHTAHGIEAFFDYEEGMAVAEQLGKPVLVDFTGLACVNCRRVEDAVWAQPEVLKLLKEDYLVLSLYVDARNLELSEDQQYISQFSGKKIKTLAHKNADIEKTWFKRNSQPFYVLLDNEENLLADPIAYSVASEDGAFLKFLNEGLKKYKKSK